MNEDNYLNNLNNRQKEAVECIDGPLLVLAGAGTGKTRVLTTRIAHILSKGKAWPNEILAVTFTNKAANEMKERIIKLLQKDISTMWLGTFHSIAAKILRINAPLVGFSSDFTIIDTDDQLRLVKQIMESQNIDHKKFSPKTIIGIISNWKDQALLPEHISFDQVNNYADGKTLQIYEEYQHRLKTLNAFDFGDLLMYNIILFQNNPEILTKYQTKFKYILVDEYQDTNVVQYLWLRLFTQTHHNVCCVGDDDQSIYGWRGAKVDNILRFEKDFPDSQIIRLEENYRSTGNILEVASHLISHNNQRLGKKLWTKNDLGNKVTLDEYYSDKDEATKIAEEIEIFSRYKNYNLKDCAILVRAGYQTRIFEDVFLRHSINYKIVGGQRFYEYKEIRDVIAYIRVLAQPRDSLAFQRIINIPKRGVGDTSINKLLDYANANNISLFEAAENNINNKIISGKSATNLDNLVNQFKYWNKLREDMHYADAVAQMLDDSGYIDMWKNENTDEAKGRLENIQELLGALKNDHKTIIDFLEHVSLVMDTEDRTDDNKVSIMTLHAAKGLEFPIIFLPGWNNGTFPVKRAIEKEDTSDLEEERRLAYVGITRSREHLFISYCINRYMYGNFEATEPSIFIEELPEEFLNIRHKIYNRKFNHHNHEKDLQVKSKNWYKQSIDYKKKEVIKSQYIESEFDQAIDIDKYSLNKNSKYQVGNVIRHKTYGKGCIISINGDILRIAFESIGIKNIKQLYVEIA